MTQKLLPYLKINCQDIINSAYLNRQIEEEVYYFAQEWLNLIIKLLEPIIHENTKESQQFIKHFFYGDENDFLQSHTSFFTQIKLGVERLKLNHSKEPLNFYTRKHEKKANNIVLAGFLSAIASIALGFYISTLFPLPLTSLLIISASIMLIFCVAAIHPLQKSKSLENALAELVFFDNQPKFMAVDKIRLFTQFESCFNELDLPRFSI